MYLVKNPSKNNSILGHYFSAAPEGNLTLPSTVHHFSKQLGSLFSAKPGSVFLARFSLGLNVSGCVFKSRGESGVGRGGRY